MNKRSPLLLTLLGTILLAASLAYWFLQFYKPPQRPIVAAPQASIPDPPVDAAATLFGGQVAVASATNYQLTGIVAAGRDSVAILVADGAPPKALRLGRELSPGVSLAEVHPRYVMLSDGGVLKRVDLAVDAKGAAPMGAAAVPPMAQSVPPGMPSGSVVAEPPLAPGAVANQVPATNPGDVGQRDAPPQNPNAAPANNNPNPAQAPVQMAPPVRAIGVPTPSPGVQ